MFAPRASRCVGEVLRRAQMIIKAPPNHLDAISIDWDQRGGAAPEGKRRRRGLPIASTVSQQFRSSARKDTSW